MVVLFDLDDTLIVNLAWTREALLLASQPVGDLGLTPEELARAVQERAHDLWLAAPTHPYCLSAGIGHLDGLVSDTPGDGAAARLLGAWLADYRRLTWEGALAAHGVDDPDLARSLSGRFREIRRSRQPVATGALPLLDGLRARPGLRLGLVTNGPSDVQHEKLRSTGLRSRFDAVVVSGDHGTGKPDPAIFRSVLAALDERPEDAIMVGDSLRRDVAGARAAGLTALWVSHGADRQAPAAVPDLVAADLPAAADLLDEWLDGRPAG